MTRPDSLWLWLKETKRRALFNHNNNHILFPRWHTASLPEKNVLWAFVLPQPKMSWSQLPNCLFFGHIQSRTGHCFLKPSLDIVSESSRYFYQDSPPLFLWCAFPLTTATLNEASQCLTIGELVLSGLWWLGINNKLHWEEKHTKPYNIKTEIKLLHFSTIAVHFSNRC